MGNGWTSPNTEHTLVPFDAYTDRHKRASLRPMILRRRNLLALFVVEVVLFVLAGVTSKTSSHPGTVSNVFWGVFLVGVVLLVVLVVATLVQSRRSRAN